MGGRLTSLVLDASAMVDLLLEPDAESPLGRRLRDADPHVPAHFDMEVLSALGRIHRAGALTAPTVSERLRRVGDAPFERHPLPGLLDGAWARRRNLRLTDALYVELATQLGDIPLVTTDRRLAEVAPLAELISG